MTPAYGEGGGMIARPGPRPGLGPVVRAAAWSVVVDTFRIAVFLLGAQLLGSIAAALAFLAIDQGGGPLNAPGRATYAWIEMLLVPWASLFPVAEVLVVAAYLGLRLPARITAASTYDERVIRRGVAVTGAVVPWLVLPLSLDVVLAIGYTLVPVAFAVAALRGPRQPPIARGWRPYLALSGGVAVVGVAIMTLWLNAPAVRSDASAVGLPSSVLGLPAGAVGARHWPAGPGGTADRATTIRGLWEGTAGLPMSVQVEVWPAEIADGAVRLGASPLLVVAGTGRDRLVEVDWTMPAPRTQRLVATFAIGITPDGRRIVLDEEPEIGPTPAWHGTLTGWWLGS
jgi:hypothetical protein